jgi:hypothetical protein
LAWGEHQTRHLTQNARQDTVKKAIKAAR